MRGPRAGAGRWWPPGGLRAGDPAAGPTGPAPAVGPAQARAQAGRAALPELYV